MLLKSTSDIGTGPVASDMVTVQVHVVYGVW